MSKNSHFREYFIMTLLIFVLSVCLITGSIRAGATPPPEAYTVLEHPPAPGKRITPYLQYLVETAWRQDDLRKAMLASIRNESDLLQLQSSLRQKLLDMIGGLPRNKTQLNSRITGKIQLDGYRIEKLIFESLPGFHVTSLVYVPDGPVKPRPAVLVPCGHSPIAKSYPMYQRICERLVKRGYVVLCWDPVGQGERSQFWDKKRNRSRYNLVCGEHAVLGNLAYLAGANLARWEVWDGIRALDYLLTRADVDSTRISITGSSGGGFQTAFIGALDRRIGVVAPSCYITALPMRMNNRIFVDPDSDPEQDVYRMISSGIDHPGLLLLIYPRPLIVSAAIEDFFPIEGTRKSFREIAAIYSMFNIPERIAITEGFHKHEYSDYNQAATFDFLDNFNRMPVHQSLDSTKVFTDKELWCTRSGQVHTEFSDSKSLMEIIRQYYLERKNLKSASMDNLYHGDYYPGINTWPVVQYEGKPSRAEIAWEAGGSTKADNVVIDRYLLHHSKRLSVPLLHIYRQNVKDRSALLWFTSGGKATPSDWQSIRNYLNDGYDVISFDFRGLGENRMLYKVISIDDPSLAEMDFNQQYFSPISGILANYVYNSLLIGRPFFLQMIEDAEITARFVNEKLGIHQLYTTAPGEAYTLAYSIAEAVPEVNLLLSQQEEIIKWSKIVEGKTEIWPIQFLLPDGAYVR